MIWLKAHIPLLLSIAAGWIAVAALISAKYQKPAQPRWKVVLYTMFVDAPSFVAAHNSELSGVVLQLFGWKLAIPMLSLSTAKPATPIISVQVVDKPAAALKLLPLLILAAGLSACATAPSVAYDTLGAMSHWVQAAAEELPPSCLQVKKVFLDGAKSRADVDAFKAKVDAQCDSAKLGLTAAASAIKLAHDGIHDLAAGVASPKDLTAWVVTAMDLYNNLTAVLRPLGVKLPGVP